MLCHVLAKIQERVLRVIWKKSLLQYRAFRYHYRVTIWLIEALNRKRTASSHSLPQFSNFIKYLGFRFVEVEGRIEVLITTPYFKRSHPEPQPIARSVYRLELDYIT